MSKKIIFIFFIFFSEFIIAQNQGNIWYFGDSAGLSFNSGNPQPLIDGIISSQESSASICSNGGDFLFYISSQNNSYNDSLNIRNRFHQIMPNGLGIKGYPSCTQGSLIIPFPSDTTKYYIFTISTYLTGGTSHLFYSCVDMTLDSGKGDVSQKNVLLCNDYVTEKLNTVKHANGRDWWLLLHTNNSNTFNKYLVTPTGPFLNDSQTIGTVYSNYIGFGGQMIFSKNGDKLLCAGTLLSLDLFDFDRCTVSHRPIHLV